MSMLKSARDVKGAGEAAARRAKLARMPNLRSDRVGAIIVVCERGVDVRW